MGAAIVAAVVVLIAVAIALLLRKHAHAIILFVVALFIINSGMGVLETPKVSGPAARETVGTAGSTTGITTTGSVTLANSGTANTGITVNQAINAFRAALAVACLALSACGGDNGSAGADA